MKKAFKSVLMMLLFLMGTTAEAKEQEEKSYLYYVKEIVDDFAKEMEKKYPVRCCGSGGSMPYEVEETEVLLSSYERVDIERARQIGIFAVEELLRRINAHEKIRPFLKKYPFDANCVSVSIMFRTKTNEWPVDGSIASMFLSRNKLFYRSAAMVFEEPTPCSYYNEKNEIVNELMRGGWKRRLKDLFEEPYEEALKIVKNSQSSP